MFKIFKIIEMDTRVNDWRIFEITASPDNFFNFMVFETVEIFMAVFMEKFAYKFFEEHRHNDFNCPRKLVLA